MIQLLSKILGLPQKSEEHHSSNSKLLSQKEAANYAALLPKCPNPNCGKLAVSVTDITCPICGVKYEG
jgi:hypothetical protein